MNGLSIPGGPGGMGPGGMGGPAMSPQDVASALQEQREHEARAELIQSRVAALNFAVAIMDDSNKPSVEEFLANAKRVEDYIRG